jgi:rSAM/selenodomain-associated transferase 2
VQSTRFLGKNNKMISVVIPVLNESKTLGRCLTRLREQIESHEIVVVNSGSRDYTQDIVDTFPGVKWLRSATAGRGAQMNQGAAAAGGEILLFLHSDTFLPPGGLTMIETFTAQAGIVAGSFSLRFDFQNPFLRLYACFSRINHILFTYGDQGLFITRRVFERVGGFKEIPLMEDVEIQKKLRKMGQFVKIHQPVITSARRFLLNGIIRQQLLNIGLVLLYHAGVSPGRLKHYYKDCF